MDRPFESCEEFFSTQEHQDLVRGDEEEDDEGYEPYDPLGGWGFI